MPKLISLHDHPANKAPEAGLVSPFHQRDSVYATANGFATVVWQGQAIEGYFTSQAKAQHALDMLKAGNGAA